MIERKAGVIAAYKKGSPLPCPAKVDVAWLCCTNRVLKDSLPESSVLSDCYEQLDTDDVQDPELGGVQPFAEEQGIAFDLV